jgi:hypothetical protein
VQEREDGDIGKGIITAYIGKANKEEDRKGEKQRGRS